MSITVRYGALRISDLYSKVLYYNSCHARTHRHAPNTHRAHTTQSFPAVPLPTNEPGMCLLDSLSFVSSGTHRDQSWLFSVLCCLSSKDLLKSGHVPFTLNDPNVKWILSYIMTGGTMGEVLVLNNSSVA